MLKIENAEVLGWEHAIRGMRNPKNSWAKSDSGHCHKDLVRDCVTCVHHNSGYAACDAGGFDVGQNDFDLMTRLRNAGTDHRKFMRMITVYLDITAPLYWWKEFDTYKVGTVANSCSTMHKIADKPFELDDFSNEHLMAFPEACEFMGELDENIPDEASLNLDVSTFKNRSNLLSPWFLFTIEVRALNQYRNLYLRIKNKPTKDLKKKEENLKKIWWQMIQLLPSSYNQKRTVMLNYEVLANIYKSRRHHKLDEWHTLCDWIESLPYSKLITGTAV